MVDSTSWPLEVWVVINKTVLLLNVKLFINKTKKYRKNINEDVSHFTHKQSTEEAFINVLHRSLYCTVCTNFMRALEHSSNDLTLQLNNLEYGRTCEFLTLSSLMLVNPLPTVAEIVGALFPHLT